MKISFRKNIILLGDPTRQKYVSETSVVWLLEQKSIEKYYDFQ
jgi:hypothetical protein